MQPSTPIRRAAASVLVLIVLAFVAGCSSAGSAGQAAGGSSAGGGAPVAGGDSSGAAGGAPSPAATAGAGGGGTRNEGDGGNAAPAPLDASKIVRTGSLEMEVDDLDATLVRAHAAITGLGGYIGASQQSSGPERAVASITYRIPAGDWDEALAALKKLGTLVSERTEATEVGGQIVDLEARITNLRASEERVRGYMADAANVDTLLDLETRLTDIRGQIEGLEAQRVRLEDQAAYGTLTVLWATPVLPGPQASPTPAPAWNPGAEVTAAWSQLVELGQGLATFLIWLGIVVLPVVLVIGGITAALVLVGRRLGLLPARPTRTA